MKKLYNNALLYQAFYNGKWGILLGGLIFSYTVFLDLNSQIQNLKYMISSLNMNSIYFSNTIILIILLLTILGVYLLITGFNKRNTSVFLISGPYNKKEIKRNEFQILFASLGFILFLFIYISICVYFNNKEMISLIENYWSQILFTFIRLLVVGTGIIVYLMFMDMLFSNTIVTGIAMFLAPIFLISNISYILNIKYIFKKTLFTDNIYTIVNDQIRPFTNYLYNFLFGGGIYGYNEFKNYLPSIFFIIILIIPLFILIWQVNKRITINKTGKFFIFPIIETISLWWISFTIVIGIVNSILSDLKSQYYNRDIFNLSSVMTILVTVITLVLVGIISLIISKIIKKKIKGIM